MRPWESIDVLRKLAATWPLSSRALHGSTAGVVSLQTRSCALNLLCAAAVAGIALNAPRAAFSHDKIEIVQFASLTFPGSLFVPPFMPSLQDGTPATVFGILRLPEGT